MTDEFESEIKDKVVSLNDSNLKNINSPNILNTHIQQHNDTNNQQIKKLLSNNDS